MPNNPNEKPDPKAKAPEKPEPPHAHTPPAVHSTKPPAKPKAKEAPPVKVEEKEGHAVMSVDVPARTVEVSIAHSPIEGCAVAAVEAYNKVRNIKGGDVAFADADVQFRRELINSAETIYRGAQPSVGDTLFARFEREVVQIKRKQDEEKVKTAAEAA